jgi:hypothetical protein
MRMTTGYVLLGRDEVAQEHFLKPRALRPENGEL